ncbi:MAG TPA: PAS domain S-box protein [Longimicrobium sp.]
MQSPVPTATDPPPAAADPRRPAWQRYGLALAATGAALGVSLLLRQWVESNVFIFFFAAVVLTAWFGGRGPALVVAALAVPLSAYFLLPPFGRWMLTPGDLPRLAVFLAVAALIGAMHESLARTRHEALAAARESERSRAVAEEQSAELEMQAAELQQQAAELELQTEEAQALAGELEAANRQIRESTERRLAEAEAGRHRLEAILEGLGESFVALDAGWRYTYVNRHAEATLRKSRAELLGRSIWEVFPGLEGSQTGRELHRIRAEGRPGSFEVYSDVVGSWVAVRAAPWEGGLSVFYEDVTARREAQRQASWLAALVESSQDAILSKTLDGIVQSWNRGAERLYGYTAEEMVGRPVAVLAPPERHDEIPAILERLARGERIETFETVRQRKDGTLVDVLLAVSPVFDADGKVAGASTIARDVTERKRTEARLRESEEGLRFLAEASRVLAASLDPQATVSAVARLPVPRIADYAAVVLNGPGGSVLPMDAAHVDPAKLPLLREMMERWRAHPSPASPTARVLQGGQPLLVRQANDATHQEMIADPELRRITRALAPTSFMIVPIRLEDRVLGSVALASTRPERRYGPADLALAEELARRAAAALENARLHTAEQEARRQAERSAERTARLQAATAQLSEARTPAEVGAVVVRTGTEALGAAAAWIGQLTPEGDALELLASGGYPAELLEEFRRFPLDAPLPLADALRRREVVCLESVPERDRRYPALAASHPRTANAAWVAVPMLVEGRAVGGVALSFAHEREFDGVTRDFLLAVARQAALALERARLFEAEQRARAEAEQANRAKFEFLTTMSHELRTPLNAIAGYVELLELGIRGAPTEGQLEYLARIRRSQTHLLGLINDVLNFARIDSGHVHFDLDDVPLDEALTEVEALIGPQMQAKGLEYEYSRFDPAVTVRVDPEKLRQIVLNLLSTAVKFTPSGGRVVMECARVDGFVAVRVRDTGLGIPGDKLATIFEPFVQVNAGYTRPSEGTGLGLAISRDLARAMGGELSAESRDGEGSVFTLSLPIGDPLPRREAEP